MLRETLKPQTEPSTANRRRRAPGWLVEDTIDDDGRLCARGDRTTGCKRLHVGLRRFTRSHQRSEENETEKR